MHERIGAVYERRCKGLYCFSFLNWKVCQLGFRGGQGERSELCDGGLKVIERERGGEREIRRGGVARRKRVAHLAKAQQRVQRANGQARQGECSEFCDGGLKEKWGREGGG